MKHSSIVFLLFVIIVLMAVVANGQTLKADYQFQGNLNSSVAGAPAMTNLTGSGGANSFATDTIDGYSRQTVRFPFNSGLSVNTAGNLIPSDAYTIVILFRFDQISGFRRVVSFDNRTTDAGAYILNGLFENENTANTPFIASTYIQVAIVRDANGNISAYRDGSLRISGLPDGGTFQISAANVLSFFQDDPFQPTEASAGNVARIRLYDAPMTTAQVQELDRVPQSAVTTNSVIAFTSNRSGNYQIYVMNADGSNQIRLTTNTATQENHASWSPNGQSLVFYTNRDANFEIYSMNADGTAQTRLTNNTSVDYDPDWFPDGRIVFATNRDNANAGEIYVMNADGSNPINLTQTNSADENTPAVSPDGSRIAFNSNRDGNYEIYVMNSDGTNQLRLTNTPATESQPAWSPDGTKIAFYSLRDGNEEIYVMNAADGSNQVNLTNNTAYEFKPSYSPNGSKIAFASGRNGGVGLGEIYTMNANGTSQTRLTFNSAHETRPDWRPSANSPTVSTVNPRPLLAPSTIGQTFSGTITLTGTNLQGGDITTNGPLTFVGSSTVNAAGTSIQRNYQIGCCAPQEGQTFNLFVTTADGVASISDSITLLAECLTIPINYGGGFNGILSNNSCTVNSNKTNVLTFNGTSGQQIALTMNTAAFFSKIELLDPLGAVVASAGGVNGVGNSRLPASGYFTLPGTGTYTVRAIGAFGGVGAYALSLYQAPVVNCTYSVSPARTDVVVAGGLYQFDVITQPGCAPASQPSASGAIYNGLTYSGGRVSFNVLANTGAARQDTISIAGQTHTISQYGVGAPSNDNFGTPQLISGATSPLNAPVRGYNTNSTAEPGEPAHAGNTAARSVWYSWTAPAGASGLYSFSTSGSSFDTVMAIYACPAPDACTFANMSPVGSNDDTTFFDKTSKVNFRAAAGTTYMIAIDGKGGATGTIELTWQQYERLYRLYLQNYNGNQASLVPDTVSAGNGTNTVNAIRVSQGVYEFNLPADGTVYTVNIAGPTGIVWAPNNFPLDTSFRLLDELMNGPAAGTQNSVSNAQNQTPRIVTGYVRNITSAELPALSVSIGSSRGPNPRDPVPCPTLSSTIINSVSYAVYQCQTQPQTLHDIVPNRTGKIFTISVRSFDVPIDNDSTISLSASFIASNSPTYNIGGRVLAGGAGTVVDLAYTPPGNTAEISLRTITDISGSYAFNNLPPNTYKLKASKPGFVFNQPQSISLSTNQTIDIAAQTACTYTPANLAATPMSGGPGQFLITTNDPTCEWTAASNVPWLTIYSGATVSSGPVHFTAEANTGSYRVASIRISGRSEAINFVQLSGTPTFGSISGKVLTPDARGLRNATVTITDAAGARQTITTNSFGLYAISNIRVGDPYTINVSSKRYRFNPRTIQPFNIQSTVDFVGLE